MESPEMYWQRRVTQLEARVERLEAEMSANRVTVQNRSEFFSVKEFAAAMNVCEMTIQRKVKKGEIKAVKIGKAWRIPRSELDNIFNVFG